MLKLYAEAIKDFKYQLFKSNIDFQPVFIIGCGRSGTTILGETLSKHSNIKYLNEPRDLWRKAYPKFNVWSNNQYSKLFADETDINESKSKKLKKSFHREQVASNCTILLEKLPINSFRLRFIQQCFDNAKYIYLYRNGLEVANSIAKKNIKGIWFGKNNIKWKHLMDFADAHYKELYTKETILWSDFHKGLLEWRLSIEESDRFFKTIPSERYVALSYYQFVTQPKKSLEEIFTFLSVKFNDKLINNFCGEINRKSKILVEVNDELTEKIGGKILREVINGAYSKSLSGDLANNLDMLNV